MQLITDAAPINTDSGIFGPGNVSTWTDNAICKGNETNLNDCIHMTVGGYNHICLHRQDAGVICLQGVVACMHIVSCLCGFNISSSYI